MKKTPLFLLFCSSLAGSLSSFAQEEAPRALIVEDSADDLTSVETVVSEQVESAAEATQLAVETVAKLPAEALENLLSAPVEENLPEQPAEFSKQKPSDEVVVKKEKLQQIQLSEAHSDDFQLLSPWAPKPLQKAPQGWKYIPVQADRSYPVSVTLESGKNLKLKVTPYALVPKASPSTIQLREPGYEPEKGYQQQNSVTARLSKSSQSLEQAAKSLDESIKTLSDLVNSLPK